MMKRRWEFAAPCDAFTRRLKRCCGRSIKPLRPSPRRGEPNLRKQTTMSLVRSMRWKPEILLRVVADGLILNAAVIAALMLRFFYLVAFEPRLEDVNYNQLFWYLLNRYFHTSWLLTTICLVIFALSGFYTYGRAYKGPYKALIVTQAVSLGYVVFGFASYFIGGVLDMPRGALVVAWAISIIVIRVL